MIDWRRDIGWLRLMFLVLVPSLLLNIYLLAKDHAPKENEVMVIGVVDGDTLVLEGKVRVRLRQVDAPELEYCGGGEAKSKLEELVVGKRVRLAEQIPDQYGRSMALIYRGEELVNLEMLKSGWVRYHHDTSTQEKELKAANEVAKANSLGIYSQCQAKVNTKQPACNIKGNIDKGNGEKRYYIPGCAQYEFTIVEEDVGEGWFCSEKEAQKAGYKLAATCREKR